MPLHGTVAGTGNFDSGVGDFHSYQSRKIGRVALAKGPGRIILRPDGPLKSQYLMDLRGIYLSPVSDTSKIAAASEGGGNGGDGIEPETSEESSRASNEENDATAEIKILLDGLAVGKPEEYDRIPKIWESAIAAAKRNNSDELLRLLELSLPKKGEPLADWQAVVIGGGVINGVSMVGEWPARRMAELLKDRPDLRDRWERTIVLSDEMADNKKVKTGTRYDALRIIALGDWDKYGKKLIGYLQAEHDAELQMGAVSGLSDMEVDAVPQALIESLDHLDETNLKLAIEALTRTPQRAQRLLDAINDDEVASKLISSEQLEKAHRIVDGKKD